HDLKNLARQVGALRAFDAIRAFSPTRAPSSLVLVQFGARSTYRLEHEPTLASRGFGGTRPGGCSDNSCIATRVRTSSGWSGRRGGAASPRASGSARTRVPAGSGRGRSPA